MRKTLAAFIAVFLLLSGVDKAVPAGTPVMTAPPGWVSMPPVGKKKAG